MKPFEEYIAQDILNDAQTEITKLKKGKQFKLKDLFKAIDWDAIPKAQRITAGTIFRSNAENPNTNVKNTGKTSSNSAVYEKL